MTTCRPRQGVSLSFYLYKLIPPRGSFASDMTDDERTIMAAHIAYWTGLTGHGTAVVFGPVSGDPAGSWGLAVVDAAAEDEVRQLGHGDPAIHSGMARFEIYEMPNAIARSSPPSASPVPPGTSGEATGIGSNQGVG
jgi:uncharacterized protein YciI